MALITSGAVGKGAPDSSAFWGDESHASIERMSVRKKRDRITGRMVNTIGCQKYRI
jgi:hypothetical protein